MSRPLRARRWARCAAAMGFVLFGYAALAPAQSATSVTLVITSSGNPVATIRQSSLITLTATVTATNGQPVSPGQVEFCEVQLAPLRCTDIRLLATGQLSSAGTAAYKFFPGPGTHTYQAIFPGTHSAAASASISTVLTVTPYYTTTTALSGTLTAGGYTLTATVTGNQAGGALAGTVTFEDTSNGNYILGTAALVPGPPAAPNGLSFATSQVLPVGATCMTALVADLNGDGKPDVVLGLATYNSFGVYENAIQVYLGNGDGTFTPMPPIPVYLNEIALAVGDFNGDGKPDLVAFGVTSQYGDPTVPVNQVQVLLGNGDGTFALGKVIPNSNFSLQYPALNPPPSGPFAPPFPNLANPTVAVGDINGDGIADIVFTTGQKETVAVFFGKGDGTFTAGPETFAGFNPDGIVLGDFNGDGKTDVAVTNSALGGPPGAITILLGNGDGNFTAAPPIQGVDIHTAAIVAADFNGDGILDLATETFGSPGVINIFLGNPNGTFTQAPRSPIAGTAASGSVLAVGDINGDGKPDLITANSPSHLSMLVGNGDGTFQTAIGVPLPDPLMLVASGVAVGDFIGSGLSSIVSANYLDDDATVLLPQVSPQTSTAVLSGVNIIGTYPHAVVAVYSGSITYQTSTSPPLLLDTQGGPTAVTLTVSPTTSSYGQPVVMTATLTPTTDQGHNATGTITFQALGKTLGTVPLVNGSATLTSSLLPVGTDAVAATYSGDAYFATSGGSATEIVSGFTSTSVLTSAPNPSYAGQAVTLTAAVTGVGSAVVPVGTVMFYDNATIIGQRTLDATGHASITTSTLSQGIHDLSFVYSGDLGFSASTSSAVQQVVTAQGSAATLTVTPNPAGIGQPVTLTTAVTLSNFGTAAGTIAFYDGATLIDQTTLDPSGHATFTTAALAIGTHSLTAVYPGNASFGGSTSPVVLEAIETLGFTMQLSSPTITLPTYQHTTTAITLTSLGNFADTITLSCGTPPQYVTCVFTPNPAVLTGNGTATVSFYLDTDSILGGSARNSEIPRGPRSLMASLALLLGFWLTPMRRRRLRTAALLAACALPLAFSLVGCGSNIITPVPHAAPGTYTLPVTATGTTTHLTHTTNLTLTVTP